jgi:hypothetical protein
MTIALFGAVFGSLGLTLIQGREYLESASELGRVPRVATELFAAIEPDLATGKARRIGRGSDTPPFVSYVMPVDIGEDADSDGILDPGEDEDGDGILDRTDGDVHDRDGRIQWGAVDRRGARLDSPSSPQRHTLTFEPLATFDERIAGVDIDADGHLDGRFERGNLVRVSGDGQVERFGAGMVVIPRDRGADGRQVLRLRGEPFDDANDNGVLDDDERFDDANENGLWDAAWAVEVTFLAFDSEGRPQISRERRVIHAMNSGL